MIRKKINTNITIVILVLLLSVIVFYQYIVQGNLFLPKGVLSDILRVNLPTYYHMYDNLLVDGNLWSWSMGLGTSMFAHADVYCDPFTYIIFIGGRNHIPQMLIWSFIVKIVFEALAFGYYLDYFKINKFAIIAASVLYAFSGYSLIMGGNLALGTILVYAPLVFRGIETYASKKGKKLLVASLFLTCIYSYYYFYTIGIIAAIYLLFRCYKNKKELCLKMAGLVVIGIVVVCLSAFILFPQIQLTLNSSRMNTGSDVGFGASLLIPEIKTLATAFIRTFGNNFLGDGVSAPYVGYAYDSNHDYFQTDWYVTALMIPFIFQYLYYQKSQRKKVMFYIGLSFLVTAFPIFSYVMNAFSTINYRWMFVITFFSAVLIALSIDTILAEKRISVAAYIYSLIFSVIGIVVCVLLLGKLGEVSVRDIILNTWQNGKVYICAIVFVYIAFSIIVIVSNLSLSKTIKYSATIGLAMAILIIDTYSNYYLWYGSQNATSNYNTEPYSGYEDASLSVIREIKERDQSFYRINKNFDSVVDLNGIPSDNDAMAQQYYGLKSYCSVNNPNYVSFLQELGVYVALPIIIDHYKETGIQPKDVTGPSLNYINGVYDNYELMSYLGVKYLLIEGEQPISTNFLNRLGNMGGISVYENHAVYPLAFINYGTMSLEQFKKLSQEDKVSALLNNTIIETDDAKEIKVSEEMDIVKSSEKKRAEFELVSFGNDRIEFKIYADKGAEYVSFSMPYDEDWHVYVDGKEVQTHKINVSLLGAEISEGEHLVVLKYQPKMFYLGVMVSIVTGVMLLLYLKLNQKKNRSEIQKEIVR